MVLVEFCCTLSMSLFMLLHPMFYFKGSLLVCLVRLCTSRSLQSPLDLTNLFGLFGPCLSPSAMGSRPVVYMTSLLGPSSSHALPSHKEHILDQYQHFLALPAWQALFIHHLVHDFVSFKIAGHMM